MHNVSRQLVLNSWLSSNHCGNRRELEVEDIWKKSAIDHERRFPMACIAKSCNISSGVDRSASQLTSMQTGRKFMQASASPECFSWALRKMNADGGCEQFSRQPIGAGVSAMDVVRVTK